MITLMILSRQVAEYARHPPRALRDFPNVKDAIDGTVKAAEIEGASEENL